MPPILPGDYGLGIEFLAIIFVLFVIAIVIVLGVLYQSTRHSRETLTEYGSTYPMGSHERTYTIIFLFVVLVWGSIGLVMLPYPYAHPGLIPTVEVHIQAEQFAWCLSNSTSWGTNCQSNMQIPSNSIVLFNFTSFDVNHGFGLYKSDGHLLDQVQVMPGEYNNIVFQFLDPGTYYIRCLEFCGYGHFGMVAQFNVAA